MAKLTEVWNLIQEDYMRSPTTHGLLKQLADKYDVPYQALRQKASQAGLKEERERLKENLPVRRAMRAELSKNIAEYTVGEPARKFRERNEEAFEGWLNRHEKRTQAIEGNLDAFIEANPTKIGEALDLNEKLDQQVRKLYGMSTGEEVDPSKRGIAMLAYQMVPPMLQANARVVD